MPEVELSVGDDPLPELPEDPLMPDEPVPMLLEPEDGELLMPEPDPEDPDELPELPLEREPESLEVADELGDGSLVVVVVVVTDGLEPEVAELALVGSVVVVVVVA